MPASPEAAIYNSENISPKRSSATATKLAEVARLDFAETAPVALVSLEMQIDLRFLILISISREFKANFGEKLSAPNFIFFRPVVG